MEYGVAGTIAVKRVGGNVIDKDVNDWLEKNPWVDVIDIKFSASVTHEDRGNDALIIYRKES
ncbi:hypothetical protein SAMN05421503_2451 [Terribacillus aidingensis]|uniref:Sporulation protein Cse60 n=1 Tax=Terribacillus aidingensis TaxID=586416 RepID=A0A285NYK3_9BACI|nr:hypothetical protein [Terribacillus aidingensis]SNZ14529.1 hypothetical protein SAMN05421503_2451 [Terribacillus aidingensis]